MLPIRLLKCKIEVHKSKPSPKDLGLSTIEVADSFTEAITSTSLTACKTKDENLRVTWFPPMKVDPKASNLFSLSIMPGIDYPKKLLRFRRGKKWGVHKFGDPIHFVRIR
jgi:hypothetical protein